MKRIQAYFWFIKQERNSSKMASAFVDMIIKYGVVWYKGVSVACIAIYCAHICYHASAPKLQNTMHTAFGFVKYYVFGCDS